MRRRRMMMMMSWVWVTLLTLARLNTATDPHRERRPAVLEALFLGTGPPTETDGGEKSYYAPVWNSLEELGDHGKDVDFGRPQFRCSGVSLLVRFSLIRHSDIHLEDGSKLSSFADAHHGSVKILEAWQLLVIPYTSPHIASQISNGAQLQRLKLLYFDHLLQRNVTGLAACAIPETSDQLPFVICRKNEIAVNLPFGTTLNRIKTVGTGVPTGSLLSNPGAQFVKISTSEDKDYLSEMILDTGGETSSVLIACFKTRQSGHGRYSRDLDLDKSCDVWDVPYLWDPFVKGKTPTLPFESTTLTQHATYDDSTTSFSPNPSTTSAPWRKTIASPATSFFSRAVPTTKRGLVSTASGLLTPMSSTRPSTLGCNGGLTTTTTASTTSSMTSAAPGCGMPTTTAIGPSTVGSSTLGCNGGLTTTTAASTTGSMTSATPGCGMPTTTAIGPSTVGSASANSAVGSSTVGCTGGSTATTAASTTSSMTSAAPGCGMPTTTAIGPSTVGSAVGSSTLGCNGGLTTTTAASTTSSMTSAAPGCGMPTTTAIGQSTVGSASANSAVGPSTVGCTGGSTATTAASTTSSMTSTPGCGMPTTTATGSPTGMSNSRTSTPATGSSTRSISLPSAAESSPPTSSSGLSKKTIGSFTRRIRRTKSARVPTSTRSSSTISVRGLANASSSLASILGLSTTQSTRDLTTTTIGLSTKGCNVATSARRLTKKPHSSFTRIRITRLAGVFKGGLKP